MRRWSEQLGGKVGVFAVQLPYFDRLIFTRTHQLTLRYKLQRSDGRIVSIYSAQAAAASHKVVLVQGPDFNGAVARSADQLMIAECDLERGNGGRVTEQGLHALAGRVAPDLDRLVVRATRDQIVRDESQRANGTYVP